MADDRLLGPPAVRRRLAGLAGRPLNFDPADLEHPGPEWERTDSRQALPGEPPGNPVPRGSWDIARSLMRGYEFADPSIVRAYYDPAHELAGRDMLLELRALRVLRLFVGVRVGEVYEREQVVRGRRARVWGWNYRTLEGHVEMGQMAWEVWKWLEDGAVEFRVHALSRPAPIANPVIRVGFRLLRRRERATFLDSTRTRMRRLTQVALEHEGHPEALRGAAAESTVRRTRVASVVHDELARRGARRPSVT
jgi:uncharacterized protein (UPF0548 family)